MRLKLKSGISRNRIRFGQGADAVFIKRQLSYNNKIYSVEESQNYRRELRERLTAAMVNEAINDESNERILGKGQLLSLLD